MCSEIDICELFSPAAPNSQFRMTFGVFSSVKLVSRCRSELLETGIVAEENESLREIINIASKMGKPYFTDFLSPFKSDLTTANSCWLLFKSEDKPVAMVGMRYIDLGQENLSDFADRRAVGLHYDDVKCEYFDRARLPSIAHQMRGKLVYVGDLFIADGWTGRDKMKRKIISTRCMSALCLATVSLKWPETDWIYAFARDRDMRRGAGGNYRVIVKSGSLSAACVKWVIWVSVRGHGSLRSRRMDAS
jgi:hypothetical protein